ncbi:MAG: SH3 domain-containing protein [Alteraurantiacibacter sp.]
MRHPIRFTAITLAIAAATALATPAAAQEVELPYWASIDAEEAYMRAGPAMQFPIVWVYKREGLPVRVVRLIQGWRYVEEPDGTMGWISSGLLSRQRTAMVTGDELVPMRADPSSTADLRWNVEPGVVGNLGNCSDGWCELDVSNHIGWVEENNLWGAGEP